MAQHKDVREAGERIEKLLAELADAPAAEKLVQTIVDLYGAGLARIVEIVPEAADRLIADPLVESLLLVHDLHPYDLDTRIQRALDGVRPYLGSHAGGVDYLGVDAEGVVRLKLEGSCHGCPSSTVTVRLAIERAIAEAAPETVRVEVECVVAEPTGPKLLQIGRRPPDQASAATERLHLEIARVEATRPTPVAVDVDAEGWAHLPAWPADGNGARTVHLGGQPVLVCRVGKALYAYRDVCPMCQSSMDGSDMIGSTLYCNGCLLPFDVTRAGRSPDGLGHLDPLPLLSDDEGGGVRIAVGAGAGR